VAFKTEIQIGVKGTAELDKLRKQITGLNEKVNAIDTAFKSGVQSIKRYSDAVKIASDSLQKASMGTREETRAVKDYVTAIGAANAAQRRQNKLIDEEIRKRGLATQELKKYNAAAAPPRTPGGSMVGRHLRPGTGVSTTAHTSPIGPEPDTAADFLRRTDAAAKAALRKASAFNIAQNAARRLGKAQLEINNAAFLQRTDAAAAAAKRQEVAYMAQARATKVVAKEQEKLNLALNRVKLMAALPKGVSSTDHLSPIGPMPKQSGRRRARRSSRRTQAGGGGGRLGPALIGAAFPALFGGGPGSIVGGFAGELAGPLGGVVGSALGMQFDALAEKMVNLGRALDPLNPDFETLVERLGGVGGPLEQVIAGYKELGQEEKAFAIATEELAGLVGDDGVKALKDFSASTLEVQNSFQKLLTQMLAVLAEAFNNLPGNVGENIDRAVLLGRAEKSKDPVIQDLVKRRQESRAGSLSGHPKTFMQFLFGGDPEEFARLTEEIIKLERQGAEQRAAQNLKLGAELRAQIEAKKRQADLDKQAKILLDEKIQKHKMIQGQLQAQITTLNGQVEVFRMQAKTADQAFSVAKARNDAEMSFLKLTESRLTRSLDRLKKLNGGFATQKVIINQIADVKEKQARLEFKNTQAQIKQMLARAEVERQGVEFQVQRIRLQIEMLNLQAQEIEDTKKRAEALARINAERKVALDISKQMIISADATLGVTKEIAKFQQISANNLLKGKLESIESERLEARRAVHSAAIARNHQQAAAAVRQKSEFEKKFALGAKTTHTVTTQGPIDPEVKKRVIGRGGFRSVEALVAALDKEQRRVNSNKRPTALAKGGHVTGAQLALIGEQGPEYVVPEKKAAAFATNYLMGARGAAAIPRFADGGYTGPINIQTGPVMQQEGRNFVSVDQFEKGLLDLASAMSSSSRSFGGRSYMGVR